MSVTEIKLKIAAAAEQLDEAQALQLLQFVQALLQPQGTPGRDLLPFVGSVSAETADQMLDALQESRQIDSHAW